MFKGIGWIPIDRIYNSPEEVRAAYNIPPDRNPLADISPRGQAAYRRMREIQEREQNRRNQEQRGGMWAPPPGFPREREENRGALDVSQSQGQIERLDNQSTAGQGQSPGQMEGLQNQAAGGQSQSQGQTKGLEDPVNEQDEIQSPSYSPFSLRERVFLRELRGRMEVDREQPDLSNQVEEPSANRQRRSNAPGTLAEELPSPHNGSTAEQRHPPPTPVVTLGEPNFSGERPPLNKSSSPSSSKRRPFPSPRTSTEDPETSDEDSLSKNGCHRSTHYTSDESNFSSEEEPPNNSNNRQTSSSDESDSSFEGPPTSTRHQISKEKQQRKRKPVPSKNGQPLSKYPPRQATLSDGSAIPAVNKRPPNSSGTCQKPRHKALTVVKKARPVSPFARANQLAINGAYNFVLTRVMAAAQYLRNRREFLLSHRSLIQSFMRIMKRHMSGPAQLARALEEMAVLETKATSTDRYNQVNRELKEASSHELRQSRTFCGFCNKNYTRSGYDMHRNNKHRLFIKRIKCAVGNCQTTAVTGWQMKAHMQCKHRYSEEKMKKTLFHQTAGNYEQVEETDEEEDTFGSDDVRSEYPKRDEDDGSGGAPPPPGASAIPCA